MKTCWNHILWIRTHMLAWYIRIFLPHESQKSLFCQLPWKNSFQETRALPEHNLTPHKTIQANLLTATWVIFWSMSPQMSAQWPLKLCDSMAWPVGYIHSRTLVRTVHTHICSTFLFLLSTLVNILPFYVPFSPLWNSCALNSSMADFSTLPAYFWTLDRHFHPDWTMSQGTHHLERSQKWTHFSMCRGNWLARGYPRRKATEKIS